MIFTTILRQNYLTPLSEESPCGINIKLDRQTFRALRNEFNLAQASLRKLGQSPEEEMLEALIDENNSNWKSLSDNLSEVFSTTSRDIELAGWMMTAQVIIDPTLSGIAQASGWLQDLVSSDWTRLQPILPEEKIKSVNEDERTSEMNGFKMKAFSQLLGESVDSGLLYHPLLMTPIIADLTYSKYKSEEHKGKLASLRGQYHSLAMNDRENINILIENLTLIRAAFTGLEGEVQKMATQSSLTPPSFQFVIGLINKILIAIEYISGLKPMTKRLDADEPVNEGGDLAISHSSLNENTDSSGAGHSEEKLKAISLASLAEKQDLNRDMAFMQLRELSEYFKKTEPHSPVAYLLEKAIRWGYLGLPDLMAELLSDKKITIQEVFKITGLDESDRSSAGVGGTNFQSKYENEEDDEDDDSSW